LKNKRHPNPDDKHQKRHHRMKNILKLLCMVLLGTVLAGNADAAMCGFGTCNEESRHPASSVSITNGMGGTIWYSNVTDYAAIAVAACNYYGAAHNGTMTSCVPQLPLGAAATGGTSGSLSVAGYFNGSYGVWNMISFGCSDALNNNNVVTGTDAQCYCNRPLMYSSSKNACVNAKDWFNPRTPKDSSVGSCPVPEYRTPHPLYPLTGSKSLTRDLGLVIGKEAVSLSYDTRGKIMDAGSTATVNGKKGAAIAYSPSFDGLWFSSLHRSLNLQRTSTGNAAFIVQAIRSDGQIVTFNHPSATSYSPLAGGIVDKLAPELNAGTPTNRLFLTDKAGNVETYDSYDINSATTADLVRIDYVNGGYVNFTYTGRLLTKVTDHAGRSIRFQYSAAGSSWHISQITGTDGRSMAFTYDANQMLQQITWPDGKTLQYLHENAAFPWAVTGVVDENASRLFTFGYDAQGRAVDSQFANGAEHYAVSYGTPPALSVSEVWDNTTKVLNRYHNWTAPQGVSVTGPNGVVSAVGSSAVNGMNLVSSQTAPAGSGCAASSNAVTYDAVGNVLSLDDFQGQRSCFAYDGNHRETVRVEGLANTASCATVIQANAALPGTSRKITTTWHPDWRLPVATYAPGSVTTNIYQGQADPFNGGAVASCTSAAALPNGKPVPVLCKQVLRATTDADGSLGPAAVVDTGAAQRTSSFTYDAAGRTLTSTDPMNRVASYAYYGNSTDFTDPSANADPSFGSVSLLLHGDGTDGDASFVDSSAAFKAVTAGGGARTSTAQSRFGASSIYFDGVRDYVSLSADPSLAMKAADFTIEMWIYKLGNNANHSRLWNPDGDFYTDVNLQFDPTGKLVSYGSTTGTAWNAWAFATGIPVANNVWKHVALVRAGGTVTLYVDGVGTVLTTSLGTAVLYDSGRPHAIGGQGLDTDRPFNGYVDDLRVTKGLARYTANFTPPTQAFPDTGGQTLDPNAVGHRAGDLQSITNAAGHVTQFTLYDGVGRVKQMVDAKGVVTDTVYTPRGWTSSVAVTPPGGTARTTNYSYDNAGQLTGATLPDGSTLGYSYDAAHRLTGITDAKGNSVTYTLDNAGNKVGEQVKDPSNNLQRNITRVYDALNRVQQVTGASN
jgi:YD repeat-containing protein